MPVELIRPGVRVLTLRGEEDLDHEGQERTTPAGSVGHVTQENHVLDGERHWDVAFPNGCWVVITDTELRDAAQYTLDDPFTAEQLLLSTQWLTGPGELTILDDVPLRDVQDLIDLGDDLLDLIRRARDLADRLRDMPGVHASHYEQLATALKQVTGR